MAALPEMPAATNLVTAINPFAIKASTMSLRDSDAIEKQATGGQVDPRPEP